MLDKTNKTFLFLLNELKNANIDFVVCEVFCQNNQIFDILINKKEKERIKKVCKKQGIKKCRYEAGSVSDGWMFLYGAQEPDCYMIEDITVQFRSELCCMSVMEKKWIPLDKAVQDKIWEEKVYHNQYNIPIICKKMDLVLSIIYSVFNEKEFKKQAIGYITRNIDLLNNPETKSILETEFYKFTDRLIYLIREKQFNKVVDEYISFSDY